jgi:hypothetical protein
MSGRCTAQCLQLSDGSNLAISNKRKSWRKGKTEVMEQREKIKEREKRIERNKKQNKVLIIK